MATEKKSFQSWINSLAGDRVILMITLLLMMISFLTISSATASMVKGTTTRSSIMLGQFLLIIGGLIVVFICYQIRSLKLFRIFAQLGWIVSVVLLSMLLAHFKIGNFITTPEINGARRAIVIKGFQIHVYEVVKVAMIMYIAWAVHAYHNEELAIANMLADTDKFAFMGRPFWKKFFYIYLPIVSVCLMIVGGSLSTAAIIGAVLFAVMLIGGISVKELIPFIFILGLLLAGCVGIHFASGGKYFTHLGTAVRRIGMSPEKELMNCKGTAEFEDMLNKYRQPVSAKIAISEGNFLVGKGPGSSSQRYVVPIMYEDYMFAFIVEEYGLIGALIVLILYASLLARGALIVSNCDNIFAKTAIAGLVLLISGQALLHIAVNVGIGLTGQTLPLISYGKSSFLMFSLAFGIILSISRIAKEKLDKASQEAVPISSERDEVRESLRDLDFVEDL